MRSSSVLICILVLHSFQMNYSKQRDRICCETVLRARQLKLVLMTSLSRFQPLKKEICSVYFVYKNYFWCRYFSSEGTEVKSFWATKPILVRFSKVQGSKLRTLDFFPYFSKTCVMFFFFNLVMMSGATISILQP